MRRELLLLSLCFVLYIASASAPLSFRRCDGCTSEGVENQLQPEAAVDGFQVLWQRRLLQQVQTTKLTLDSRTCTFFALAAFGFFLASGAGVGGGDVLVPLLLLVAEFPIGTAVALSNIGVFGNGVGNFLLNVRRRHPREDKPLIDWELVTLMEPSTVAGAVFAGYLNKVLPVWLISALLLMLLVYLTYSMGKKGSSEWKEETEQHEDLEEKTDARNLTQNADADEESDEPPPEQHSYEDKLELPGKNLALLAILYTVLVGSDLSKSAVRCATLPFWLIVGSIIPVALAIAVAEGQKLLRQYRQAAREGHKFQEGDVKWTARNVTQWPLLCTLAGATAGLFGIGGGIVKGPMMLKMGVLPEVASATCSTMILFTSLASSLTYAFFGGIPWGFAAALFGVGLLVTVVGQLCTQFLVAKLGRQSIIVLAMAALNGVAAVLMVIQAFTAIKGAAQGHELFKLRPLC